MMRIFVAAIVLIFATTAVAKGKHKHNHKAHAHGIAKLNVAVDDKTIVIELTAPGDVIFGFEHKPKSEKDKTTIGNEMARLNDNATELFITPADASCSLTSKTVNADQAVVEEGKKGKHSDHADVAAKYTFTCANDLKGKALGLGLFKVWPRLKTLNTQVIGSAGQKGLTLKNDVNDLPL